MALASKESGSQKRHTIRLSGGLRSGTRIANVSFQQRGARQARGIIERRTMLDRSLHPNSRALLDAWRRLTDPKTPVSQESLEVPSDLVSHLFLLQQADDEAWAFRYAGDRLSDLMGRELRDRDFMSLWSGGDRDRIAALIRNVSTEMSPGVAHGRAKSCSGGEVPMELLIAPFSSPGAPGEIKRLLGLYQLLGPTPALGGRPIERHALHTVNSIARLTQPSPLRLVVSNA